MLEMPAGRSEGWCLRSRQNLKCETSFTFRVQGNTSSMRRALYSEFKETPQGTLHSEFKETPQGTLKTRFFLVYLARVCMKRFFFFLHSRTAYATTGPAIRFHRSGHRPQFPSPVISTRLRSGKTLSDSLPELGNERKSVLFRENFLFIGKNGVYYSFTHTILRST